MQIKDIDYRYFVDFSTTQYMYMYLDDFRWFIELTAIIISIIFLVQIMCNVHTVLAVLTKKPLSAI